MARACPFDSSPDWGGYIEIENWVFSYKKQNNPLYSRDHLYRRLFKIKHSKMTLIIGAKCKDGVVIIADRRVTNSDRLVEKIRKPEKLNNIIFTAGGYETVFKDYLVDVSRKAEYWYNWYESQKEKDSSFQHDFDYYDFKKCCIEALTELRHTYRALGESEDYAQVLQVLFAMPEDNDGKIEPQLYFMDMDRCAPQPVELGKVIMIGYREFAWPLVQSIIDNKENTMADVARVASFTIKFIEDEKLTQNAVGVGDLQPQIYFFPNNNHPEEPKMEHLTVLMKDVDIAVSNMRNTIGKSSGFLKFVS